MSTLVRDRELVATFVTLADTLVDDFDVVAVLSGLAERIVAFGYATEVGALLADEDGELRLLAASHGRAHELELFQVEHSEGPCHDAFASRRLVDTADLQDDAERWPQFAPRALDAGFRSVHAVPLCRRDEVLGALDLFNDRTGPVPAEVLTVVKALADVATIGMLHRRELQRAHRVQGQLEHALHSRIGIEQAKGALSAVVGLPVEEAFELLRGHARRNNRKLADVARDVLAHKLSVDDLRTT